MDQQNECLFCLEEQEGGLCFMMADALKAKYTQPPKEPLTHLDTLLKLAPPASPAQALLASKFKEYVLLDEEEEMMRREYRENEYEGKITMLSEYYKFHNDVPKIVEIGVEKIMGRYYDKRRGIDYRKIKKVLKEEKGISISSVDDGLSSMDDSALDKQPKRDKYSTLLNAVNEESQQLGESQLLQHVWGQMDQGFKSKKPASPLRIRGVFEPPHHFEQYLKTQTEESKAIKGEKHRILKKFNYQDLIGAKAEKTSEGSTTIKHQQNKEINHPKDEKRHHFLYKVNLPAHAQVQVRNAKFYSEGQPVAEVEQYNQPFKKKKTGNIGSKHYASNQLKAAEVYRSNHDLRIRQLQSGKLRSIPQESKRSVRSHSKLRRNSQSNRKLTIQQHPNVQNGIEGRSLSTTSLKRRSVSTSTSVRKLERGLVKAVRPVQAISRYGFNNIQVKGANSTSIKEMLNRKLNFQLS